jgi:hypothetical protein
VERGIPAILFHEDLELLCPYMHTVDDVVGTALNSDELFQANVRAAAATLFTLARPIQPAPLLLFAVKDRANPDDVRLTWTGGFPGFDLHRVEDQPWAVGDDGNRVAMDLGAREHVDPQPAGDRLYYAVEEFR